MKSRLIPSTAILGLCVALNAHANLLVYEGFNYTPGSDILTPLNGGLGFSGAWARAEEGPNDSITVVTGVPANNTGDPATGDLDGVFNNAAVTTSPAGSANRYIDGATVTPDDRITALRPLSQSAGALAGADKVLWASVIWTMNGSNFGRQVGFVLGTDGLRNRSQNVSTNTSWGGSGAGDAIGVGGAINTLAVTPTIWDGGNQVVRTTTGAKTLAANQDNIVILKFVFADGTTPDRVHAWGFGETETITEDAFNTNASAVFAEAVIDQDALNILSFGQSQVGIETIDEIRLGDTFADVTSGLGEPPQPLEMTDISYESASDRVTLTWKSNPGENYGLYWSTDLAQFEPGINPAVPAHATAKRTSYGPFANPVPAAPRMFFRVGPPDLEDPELQSLWGNNTTVSLAFSEPMHPEPATNPGNFNVQAEDVLWPIASAALSPDGRTVTLTLDTPLAIGTAYTVTMSNLTDLAHRPLASPAVGYFQTWDDNPDGVQVFILAGQSNMVGHGKREQGVGDVPGAIGGLRYLVVNDVAHYGHLLVDPGQPSTSAWNTRSDVKVWWRHNDIGQTRAVAKGDLDAGFAEGRNPDWFGPELGFGWVLGEHFPNKPVLLVKTCWGGKSLHVDFRPPSAAAARGGVVGPYYTAMIEYVRDVLGNLGGEFPEFGGIGYRIAGFGWHQGWNDRGNATSEAAYEANLVDLINDLRAEFGRPDLPISIGTTGMVPPGTPVNPVELAQLAVADPDQHAEFAGTVFTVDTRPFWRDASESPSNFGYHWNHNGETHFLIGDAMGQGMVDLLTP